MSFKVKTALFITIFFWASAFVGIRAGLQEYSPQGLALLRYIVASLCMGLVYFRLPNKTSISLIDKVALIAVGMAGIGIYNLTLNLGETTVSSGTSSFIISQSPLITTIFAIFFLGEALSFSRIMGFIVSVLGVCLIALGEKGGLKWDTGLLYIVLATLTGGCYSVMQKPFLKKYNAIEATTYVIWGGTLFLAMYTPQLQQDLTHASWLSTLVVCYLGIFPAAIGYIAWSYVLASIPATRAVSFLYFMPFLATLLGWLWLNEIPSWVSLVGGICAVIGVYLVNQSYQRQAKMQLVTSES